VVPCLSLEINSLADQEGCETPYEVPAGIFHQSGSKSLALTMRDTSRPYISSQEALIRAGYMLNPGDGHYREPVSKTCLKVGVRTITMSLALEPKW
jgi:hypothetical protein